MEALRLAREAKEVPQVGDSAVEILQMEALRLARKAMKALRLAREFGGTGETSVEQDLRNILGRFHTAVVGGFRRENGHFALAADRRWLVCETEQKQVALHDLDAPGGFAPAAYLDTPPSEIRAVEVHPGGAFVATAGKDGSAHLWRYLGAGPMSAKQLIAPDLNTQHVSGDASAPRTKARRVRWSPQGAWLAVYGTDPGITLFRVGPQGIDRQLTLRGHVKPVEFVHFTPDESRLITACSNHEDRSVRVWDLSASAPSKAVRLLPPLDYRIRDVILTTDGHWLVAGDESTTLRFSPAPFAGPGAIKVQGKGGGCQQITLDPSGGFLLVGWSARPGPAFTAYRPGKPFYVPGVDVFNMQDPSKRLESVPLAFPPEANEEVASKIVIASIKIAPGGERLVIGLVGGKAYLWDRADVPDGGSPGRSLKTAGEEPVDLLEFSGDGQWLALGSTHARRIQLFHLFHSQEGSPEEILPLSLIEDHEVNLRGFKFRRSNLDLISMDENGVVRAADLRHGNPPLLPARLGGGGVALLGTAATRDANRFATWGSDHRLRIYTRAGDRFTDDELPDVVPDEEKSKVVDMAWGASYERLALATSDFNGARVQLWSVPKSGISPSRLAQWPYLLNAEGCFEPKLRWSEDGAQLAVVLDDRVEILDAARGWN